MCPQGELAAVSRFEHSCPKGQAQIDGGGSAQLPAASMDDCCVLMPPMPAVSLVPLHMKLISRQLISHCIPSLLDLRGLHQAVSGASGSFAEAELVALIKAHNR